MAFIYLSSGHVVHVSEGREKVLQQLQAAGDVVEFDVAFPAGNATQAEPVSFNPMQIVAVSEQPLPQP
jgi:hypothetical protein